ncbi:MAG: hypothetical protein ACREN6_08180 [Gemmatimonadaceae bacterium]
MTILQRVERARRTLRSAAIGAASLRALATALALLLLAATVDAFVALPPGARRAVPFIAAAAAVAVFLRRLRRAGVRGDAASAALWIEARFPSLRYTLVTAVDPRYAGQVPEIEHAAGAVPFEPAVRKAARKALAGPAIATVSLTLVLLLLPAGAVARVVRPAAGDALSRARARSRTNPLATVVVHVSPPAYAGLQQESFDNPASVRALVGSALSVEGVMGDGAVAATVGDSGRKLAAVQSGDRWTLALVMSAVPTAIRLQAAAHERLLVLEPAPDSSPSVVLTLPARDSILRTASGQVRLAASATDDYGLASGVFELIVSSGSGENFTFKTRMLGATKFSTRAGELAATLALDSIGLQPGDMLHIRAIVRDRNNVTGPGVGTSDTRTLRIARSDEYDSVAVDPAPPPEAEKNALSQRMLLMLAQALQQKRPKISHSTLVNESRAIAVDQTRLRKRVGEIVFTRLGEDTGEEGDAVDKRLDQPVNPDSVLAAADRAASAPVGTALEGNEDETPVVATNRPLLEAYNAMWSASSELEIGEPGKAIPFMKKALDALQAARSAERIYLRGKTQAVVVDIERVRLQGKDKGVSSVRVPRLPADPARDRRIARFDAALQLVRTAPAAAVDSLLLLRLDLLDRDAGAARAIESAANALRGGHDATNALIRARRMLASTPAAPAPLGVWGAVP